MIFVTVGTGKFEALVMAVDGLKGRGDIKEEVVIQIGDGSYIPMHCRWFRFAPLLAGYYKKARLVISHGGPGTVYEVLDLGKRLIAVPNVKRTDPRHQVEFLDAISKTESLIYSDLDGVARAIKKAKDFNFKKYLRPECRIHEKIIEFLGE